MGESGSILVVLNTALLAITVFFLKRSLDKLDEMDERQQDHGERIARLEAISGPHSTVRGA